MNAKVLVLIVEDDSATREMLRAAFTKEGHIVYTARTIKEAEEALSRAVPDLVVLDRELPDGDGIQLCLRIRKNPVQRGLGLLMLTGKGKASDKVLGLRWGADDYLAKPFELEELLARADALMRRGHGEAFSSSRVACADIVVDVRGRRVLADGDEVALSKMEYSLLKTLVERAGTVLTREFLNWSSRALNRQAEG